MRARTIYYNIIKSMYVMITMKIVLGIGGSVIAIFVIVIMVVFSSLGYGQKKSRGDALARISLYTK